jgi:hypothetical protein
MRINKYKPHLLVLPEDDANRQIANGFLLNLNLNTLAIQVLPEAGGWKNVVEKFKNDYAATMGQYSDRIIALLIDFDQNEDRLDYVKKYISSDLENRVFVLGVLSEPEKLRSEIGKSFERIGETLADDCPESRNNLWNHELLKHNKAELERLLPLVKPFLFN